MIQQFLEYFYEKSKEAFLRFPLVILSSFISACILIFYVRYENIIPNAYPYLNQILIIALGIPLYFCVSIFVQKQKLNLKQNATLQILATALLVFLYFTLPNTKPAINIPIPYIQYGIFNIVVHLIVSYIPFIKKKELNGFWNYNKMLFIRFLTSMLFSLTLYLGLFLALIAFKYLFDVEIDKKNYLLLFIGVIGFFHTWFFVAGIPKDLDKLESIRKYPLSLKIFSQYILLPLLIIYVILLYIYGTQILINWHLPKGMVTNLIISISILGILTHLLIYPYGTLKENSLIKKTTTLFYYILIPLIIMLYIAIGLRIYDYGFTLKRSAVVVLGIWITLITIYFSFLKTNIKFIPISLSIFLLFISFGPWSIFSISETSQFIRLKNLLEKTSILKNGKLINEVFWDIDSTNNLYTRNGNINMHLLNDSLKSQEDFERKRAIYYEIKSILDYLEDNHGFDKLKPLFKQNLDSILNLDYDFRLYRNSARFYMAKLGLDYENFGVQYTEPQIVDIYISYDAESENLIQVSDYDYFINFEYDYKNYNFLSFKINGLQYEFSYDTMNKEEVLILKSKNDLLYLNLTQFIKRLKKIYGDEHDQTNITKSDMLLYGNSKTLKVKIEFTSILLKEDVNEYKKKVSTSASRLIGKLFIKNLQ